MERSTHHSASHSRAAPPAPSKFNIAPRAEQYSEIFDSFRPGRAGSIPLLDLPPFDDSSTAFDISGFVYSEIFGGIDILDFALSSDQLFRTQIGTQSEESYPSTSLVINNYVLNGDFHQTAASKFNFPYQKIKTTEAAERFSYEVANDVIFPDVSSGIPVEPQSNSAFAPSHGSFKENGRPYGITLIPTVMSESGPFLTMESRNEPQNSAVTRIKDHVDSMSEYESSKSNYAKSFFHVSTSDFLDAEFHTGSSGIASAEAFKEAMGTAKVNMNSVGEVMERKKDGLRPLEIDNMNGTERVRMVFHESVSRDEVLQPKHACDHNLFKIYGKGMQDPSEASHVLPDSLQAEKHSTGGAAKPPHQSASRAAWKEDNGRGLKDANHLEDNDEACTKKRTEGGKRMMSPRGDQQKSDMCLKNAEQGRGKRKNEMCEKEESETNAKDVQEIEQCQNNVEAATVSHCYEKKLIHSVEKKTYEKLLVATTDNRTEQRVDKASCLMSSQHLQQSETQRIIKDSKHNHQKQSWSSDVSQIVGHKVKAISGNLDPEDIKNSGKFRSLEESQREHLREFKQERRMERERELELEKIKKLQLKKLEESREREKDRMGATAGHERAYAESDDKAVARQRAMAEARERLEKACANAREKKSLSEKASSTEARFRAQYIAAAQERELAIQRQKAMAESDTSSSSDVWICGRSDESEGQKSRARLERHRRTIERVAKALADKSVWDLIAEKEQAEKNSLAESLDGDIKRWSKGKEGNLRALLSTLQYILGPDSGWHWIPLTDIIAPGAVKKAYRKATLCVHPDKLQQRGATVQQKYICEKVFDLLKDSWNKFNLEERLPT